MTQEHPITPPPELVDKLASGPGFWTERLVRAFQAGADQELEACCANVHTVYGKGQADWLRSMRRPKPPSLKEQALAELDLLKGDANAHGLGFDAPAIRRALESLPE